MQIRSVPPDDVALTRVVEEGWVAYCESAVSAMRYTISTTAIDEYLRDHLDSSAGTLWVLLDDPDNRGTPIGRVDATLAGFILTARHEAPQKFDWPDQLEIRYLWVPRAYRGATAAAALVDRAIQQAREYGYRRLTVRVDVGNEQGRSFFGSLGLEPRGYRMHAPIADVKLDTNERIRDRPSLHLRRVRPDPAVLQRFVEVCWVPFWRALEGAVDADSPSLGFRPGSCG